MHERGLVGFLIATMGALPSAAWAGKACFAVERMTCATCPLTVKAAVKKIAGVQTVTASLERKEAEVTFDPSKTSEEAIGMAIDKVGYPATTKACRGSEG